MTPVFVVVFVVVLGGERTVVPQTSLRPWEPPDPSLQRAAWRELCESVLETGRDEDDLILLASLSRELVSPDPWQLFPSSFNPWHTSRPSPAPLTYVYPLVFTVSYVAIFILFISFILPCFNLFPASCFSPLPAFLPLTAVSPPPRTYTHSPV